MKKFIKADDSNTRSALGTTIYPITVEQLRSAFEGENIWLDKSLQERGIDAIDTSTLFGSQVFGQELYLCITDGYEVQIDGQEYDPEAILEDYGPSSPKVREFLQEPTPEIIRRHITSDEFHEPWFNEWAPSLLRDGHKFLDILYSAQQNWLFDN